MKLAIGMEIGAQVKGSFLASMQTSKERIDSLSEAVKGLDNKKIALENVKKYRLALSELTEKKGSLGAVSRDLKLKINSTVKELRKAKSEAKSLGINTANLTLEEKKLNKSLIQTNTSLSNRRKIASDQSLSDKLSGKLTSAKPKTDSLKSVINQAIDFESVMSGLKRTVNFPKAETFKELEQDILKLHSKIPVTYAELAKLVEIGAHKGVAKTREELVSFAEDSGKMALALDVSNEKAGLIMAKWRSEMGLTREKSLNLAGAVLHTSKEMQNVKAADLSGLVESQGKAAISAGLTEYHTIALGAALLSTGASAKSADSALGSITSVLTKGKNATKIQKEAFARLGFSAVEMSTMMEKDAVGSIKKVFKAIKKAPADDQESIVTKLFGSKSKDTIIPLLENLNDFDKSLSLTSSKTAYAKVLQEEYGKVSSTTAMSLSLLKNKTSRLSVSIGSIFLPALNALITPIGAVVDWLADMTVKMPRLSTAIVGTVVGFMGLNFAVIGAAKTFFLFRSQISFVKGLYKDLKQSTLATTIVTKASTAATKLAAGATWLWNKALNAKGFVLARGRILALAMAQRAVGIASKVLAAAQIALGAAINIGLGPVGLIIGAVVGGAILIYKFWGPIKGFFGSVFNGIASFSAKGIGLLKNIFLKFSPLGLLIKGFSKVKTFLSGMSWAGIGSKITGSIGQGFKKNGLKSVGIVKNLFNKISNPFKTGFSKVKTFLSGMSLAGIGSKMTGSVVQGFKKNGLKSVGIVKNLFNKISNPFRAGFSKIKNYLLAGMSWKEIGAKIISSIADGLKNAALKPLKIIKSIFSKVGKLSFFSDEKKNAISELTKKSRSSAKKILPVRSSRQKNLENSFDSSTSHGSRKKYYKSNNRKNKSFNDGLSSGVKSSGAFNVNYSPRIYISGANSSSIKADVSQALNVSESQLKKMISDIISGDRRLSYA